VGARFSAPVQTGPGAHPASCTMGTGSFAGAKSGRGVTLTPHPLLVPWSWKGRAMPLFPQWVVRPVQGCTLPFLKLTSYMSAGTEWRVSHSLTLTRLRHKKVVCGQGQVPAAFPREEDSEPLVQDVVWASESVSMGPENLAPTGVRTPNHSACSVSLHRCYTSHIKKCTRCSSTKKVVYITKATNVLFVIVKSISLSVWHRP
jgi:hypothetical protein